MNFCKWFAVVAVLFAGCVTVPIDPTPPMPPAPPIPPTPAPVVVACRGCLFTPGTDIKGAGSQMNYRSIHGQANEDALRLEMFARVQAWGGNTLTYIRDDYNQGNQVLDMCLNGRRSPVDGHYFPINGRAESDFAMWGKQKYGIEKHICFIWNDDPPASYAESTVRNAVDSYDGTRLGIENVAFGTCLESDEIMDDPAEAAQICKWIMARAPNSPCIVGSANENYLIAVASKVGRIYLWLEQASHPIHAPLTRATFPAYKASLDQLAAKVGKDHTLPGEWWASNPDDVKWMTDQLIAAGYTVFGMGKYK